MKMSTGKKYETPLVPLKEPGSKNIHFIANKQHNCSLFRNLIVSRNICASFYKPF